METLYEAQLADRLIARVSMTDRSDGNLSCVQDLATVDAVRTAIASGPWTWLRQVHGSGVVVVDNPASCFGDEADAAVSAWPNTRIATQVADCVPIGLVSTGGGIGSAHAGWRGLVDGVIENTAAELRRIAPGTLTAVVGPSIGVECYEFGADDLDALVSNFGGTVRGETSEGTPALNMAAGVAVALQRAGIDNIIWANPCTSCDADRFWSWRARQDNERQAMVVELVEAND